MYASGEATAVGKVAGPPGTSSHRSSFRNTSHINSNHGDVRCLQADGKRVNVKVHVATLVEVL